MSFTPLKKEKGKLLNVDDGKINLSRRGCKYIFSAVEVSAKIPLCTDKFKYVRLV